MGSRILASYPIDLSGKKFGLLTAISIIGKSDTDGAVLWDTVCECGNHRTVPSRNLLKNVTKDCGDKRSHSGMIGKRSGRLEVIDFAYMKNGHSMWKVRCDCGTEKIINGRLITTGHSTSCGCYKAELDPQRNRLHIEGQRFGKLTAISETTRKNNNTYYWLVRCDCGKEYETIGRNLVSGETLSCGCVKIDRWRKHGLSQTKEYRDMINAVRRDKNSGWTLNMTVELRNFYTHCVVCGDTYRLCIDHVYPVSKGYTLVPGNATILCSRCNSSKKDKTPEELPENIRDAILASAKKFKDHWEWIQGLSNFPRCDPSTI